MLKQSFLTTKLRKRPKDSAHNKMAYSLSLYSRLISLNFNLRMRKCAYESDIRNVSAA